ncbi:MAG: helix-turn-helix transcriptional regulator [Bryobacteraceae bacterium]|jgi:transcriptional regulator with XRE-family HTH domain|nr:helix-turn-helix transcriptional regulator [Bryobacteraceae bacterium]
MKTQLDEMMKDPEFRRQFAVEGAVLQSAELIATLMEEQGLTKADLARRLGKSRSWVTQLLGGGRNVTVRTLAEVLYALGAELQLTAPKKSKGAAASRR